MGAITLDQMRTFPCFRGFSDEDLQATTAYLEPLTVAAGQTLFRQGEPGDATFLLVSGQLDIVVSVGGVVDHMYLLEPGAIFGEIAPLLNQARSGSAIARTNVELWRLSFASLRGALGRGEAWSVKFLTAAAQTLAARLVALDREMRQVIADLRKQAAPSPRVAELEALRKRLMTEWAF